MIGTKGLGPFRLSASAIGLLVASVALLVAGAVMHLGELLALGLAGLALVAFALLVGRRRIPLDVHRHLRPDRVTVGDVAQIELRVENHGSITSSSLTGIDFDGGQVREFRVPPLAPGESHVLDIRLPTSRRAVLHTGPIRLEASDPFHLVTSSRNYGEEAILFVRPRVHRIAPLSVGSRLDADGQFADASPNGSESFHALREYDPGDDYRLIHWRSTARTGQLMVRQFVDLAVPEQVVFLDNRAEVHDETSFELALEVTASLIAAAVDARWPVSLQTADGTLVRHRPGNIGGAAMLDHLAGCEPTPQPSLQRGLSGLVRLRSARAVVVVTGATPTATLIAFNNRLARFRRRTFVRVVPIGAPAEPVEGIELIPVSTAAEFVDRWGRLRR